MGIDILFRCVVGVKINPTSAYNEEQETVDTRCNHVKKLNEQPNYCPTCGKEVMEPYEQLAPKAKPEIVTKLGCDVNDGVIIWESCENELPFTFFTRENGEVWCGTLLGSLDNYDGATSFKDGVPIIPPKDILFNFLDNLDIEYDPGSFGTWGILDTF